MTEQRTFGLHADDPAMAEIARLRSQRDNREMLFEMAKKDVEKLIAQRYQLLEALHSIIQLDHHNHGPESRATQMARAALATVEGKP